MGLLKRLINEEDGQAVVEYVVIVAMISIVAIALIQVTGIKVQGVWGGVNDHV